MSPTQFFWLVARLFLPDVFFQLLWQWNAATVCTVFKEEKKKKLWTLLCAEKYNYSFIFSKYDDISSFKNRLPLKLPIPQVSSRCSAKGAQIPNVRENRAFCDLDDIITDEESHLSYESDLDRWVERKMLQGLNSSCSKTESSDKTAYCQKCASPHSVAGLSMGVLCCICIKQETSKPKKVTAVWQNPHKTLGFDFSWTCWESCANRALGCCPQNHMEALACVLLRSLPVSMYRADIWLGLEFYSEDSQVRNSGM